MFKHVKELADFANSKTSPDGSRRYYTASGEAYPSVTTVLSVLSRQAIMEWRQRVGNEEANKVSRKASTRGTKIHLLCGDILNNKEIDTSNMSLLDKQMFNKFRPLLDRIDNIHGQEVALYSDHLRLAGRVDCIAEYNGKLSIIDFKTAAKPKRKEWIDNYFAQAAAYAIMYEERTDIPIDQSVIMIAVEGDEPQVFVEKRDNYVELLLNARDIWESENVSK